MRTVEAIVSTIILVGGLGLSIAFGLKPNKENYENYLVAGGLAASAMAAGNIIGGLVENYEEKLKKMGCLPDYQD